MGIPHLYAFFGNNPQFSKFHELYNTRVIIDGNNFAHFIFRRNFVNFTYGGNYKEYAEGIREYFSVFFECNIKPIVIFDGAYNHRKYDTSEQRSKERFRKTKSIAYSIEDGKNRVLPINAHEVLRSILLEMGISFAQCGCEADGEITALANYYNCPVLSEDNDFYIFDIHEGFIRFSSIKTTRKIAMGTDNCKYLSCEIYHIDRFLSYFPEIDKSVLPLFETLLGKDFKEDLEKFFSSIGLTKLREPKNMSKKIFKILNWLKNSNLDDAIHQVLSHIEGTKVKNDLKSAIALSVENFKVGKTDLRFIIDDKLESFGKHQQRYGLITAPCGHAFPLQFMVLFHRGKLPSYFLNVISLNSVFLPTQVENISMESSYACSLYIRQVIYRFLRHHPTTNKNIHDTKCLLPIEEVDRVGDGLETQEVPTFPIKNEDIFPNLSDVCKMKTTELQNIICSVLDTELSLILPLHSNLQLLFACMSYWVKNCHVKPKEEFIDSIIINCVETELRSSLNDLQASSISSVLKTLLNSFSDKREIYWKQPADKGHKLDLDIIHSYSELQTCILYSTCLNMLFDCPFKNPKLHEYFDGSVLYNLTQALVFHSSPEKFIEKLPGDKSLLAERFHTLKTQLLKMVSASCSKRSDRREEPQENRN